MNDDNKKMEKIIRIKIKIVLKIIEIIKGIKIILIKKKFCTYENEITI